MKKIDLHTHVLPGVDDGARDWDTCLAMLAASAKAGVTAVVATPHYLPWKKEVSGEEIIKLCKEVSKKLLEKQGIAMDIYPGNEIYYTVDAIQDLRKKEILTLAGSRYVLVEFQQGFPYVNCYRAVKELRDGGYIPIVAHVERNECLQRIEKLQELREMGALFQMNIEALQGGMFDAGARWAKKCLKLHLIDFLASDMHGMNRRPPMREDALQWIMKHVEPEYQQELLYGNAKKIIDSVRVAE